MKGTGVAKDEREAVRLFRLAADQNNANAQWSLGLVGWCVWGDGRWLCAGGMGESFVGWLVGFVLFFGQWARRNGSFGWYMQGRAWMKEFLIMVGAWVFTS